ncbi:MAG TPA: R3H domain-containing nucleic acid-binding protein [Pyrinomonadaceae bacterium]|nr:R3H domain-containing nucleic acid-binding protein [Pyrinomonadaceae bacterium]
MNEACKDAANFLQSLFDGAGLSLSVAVNEDPGQCVLDLDGPDAGLLQAEGGELLEALQHLVNQARGRMLPKGQRLVCDVHSFRATREAELRAMANHAADRVRSTGVDFIFGPMTANERRIIHLTLADITDLYTESVGEGADRKLRVGLKRMS